MPYLLGSLHVTIAPGRNSPPVRRRGLPVATYDQRATVTLDAASRHLVRRFSWGLTPGLAAQVKAAGGGRAWFDRQLSPNLVSDGPGSEVASWFPRLARSPQQIFTDDTTGGPRAWQTAVDLSRWTIARRVLSNRQVHEVMVDFWSNLLNVSLLHDEATYWRVDYDRVIRTHALTSFDRLLRATITHPAMGLYLDNAYSSKESPNENLGRELLELHTVGVDAGYTEEHVKASARMLTGYRADVWWPSFRAFYDTTWHDTRPVRVLGFRHSNGLADGRAATAAYLSYLARHPATAQRLARRLCGKFVSDQPSAAIVDAVAKAYLANGTAIRPTLLALVRHPDFAASEGQKVRTPTEVYVATVRALGIRPTAPTTDESFVNAMYWQYREAGQAPYEWPEPNGYPEADAAWATAGRVLTSFGLHQELAARWWPTGQASFPTLLSLLPPLPGTLAVVIDHLALQMFGQPATPAVRQSISQLLAVPLTQVVTQAQVAMPWVLHTIQACLLDSPLHLHR